MRHQQQFVTEQRTQHALVDLGGDDLLDRVLDGLQPGQRLHLADDGDRVGDDRWGGMQQAGDLRAERAIALADGRRTWR